MPPLSSRRGVLVPEVSGRAAVPAPFPQAVRVVRARAAVRVRANHLVRMFCFISFISLKRVFGLCVLLLDYGAAAEKPGPGKNFFPLLRLTQGGYGGRSPKPGPRRKFFCVNRRHPALRHRRHHHRHRRPSRRHRRPGHRRHPGPHSRCHRPHKGRRREVHSR